MLYKHYYYKHHSCGFFRSSVYFYRINLLKCNIRFSKLINIFALNVIKKNISTIFTKNTKKIQDKKIGLVNLDENVTMKTKIKYQTNIKDNIEKIETKYYRNKILAIEILKKYLDPMLN